MKRIFCTLVFLFVCKGIAAPVSTPAPAPKVLITAGVYQTFFKELKEKDVVIPSFYLHQFPVTVESFNEFLVSHPEYVKSKIMLLYADQRYLNSWKADLLSKAELAETGQQPITNVSWFVARKFCESAGGRLPTIAEWEFAADANDPKIVDLLLDWYGKTGDAVLINVGMKKPNMRGLHDMHGLIWELVEDFSSVMISSDSRSSGERTNGLFCGGGSVNARDAKAYATFMRFAFRSGLRGDYCIQTLGFRCAFDESKGTQ